MKILHVPEGVKVDEQTFDTLLGREESLEYILGRRSSPQFCRKYYSSVPIPSGVSKFGLTFDFVLHFTDS